MTTTERQSIDPRFAEMLDILHAGGVYGYWWNTDRTGRKRTEWWPVGARSTPANGVENAYFGIHPTVKIPDTNRRGEFVDPQNVRAQIGVIAAINTLFGEFDAKDHGGKDEALAYVQALTPPPSIVVDSGGGYHAYWLLDATWRLDSDDERERAKDVQARWVKFVGSDPQSKDLARVLRVPGTHNLKYDDRPLVQFVVYEPTRQYDLDYLISLLPVDEALPPIAARQPTPAASIASNISDKRIAAYVQRAYDAEIAAVVTAPDGHKHETLRNAAVKIGGLLQYGISENDAFNALYNAIVARATDAKKAADTIRDGLEFGKQNGRDLGARLHTVEPWFNPDGMACCPTHHTPLMRSKSGNGWRCADSWDCFYWAGVGYAGHDSTHAIVSEDTTSHPQYTRSWLEEDELSRIQLPRFLVDGVIVMGETTIIYGPSDAGKTFVVIDMAMRVAQYYGVMYVAGEDMSGVRLRKTAWQQYYRRAPNGNFRMWNAPFSLFNNEDVDNFILQNKAAGTRLIVFDTLSQCSLGADENSNTDMAIVMNNANRIAHEVGAAVIIIHHTTKGESSWRGAAAIKGNTYGFFLVEKPDDVIKLECIRIKNSAPTQDKYYKLVEVQVDGMYDPNGAPIVSCVIRPSRAIVQSDTLTKRQLRMLETIGMIAKVEGKAVYNTISSSMDVRGDAYYKPLNILLARGYVEIVTTKQGNANGYTLSNAGRDYLMQHSQSVQRISENDFDADLFVVNSIVDGDTIDLAPLPQVEEPSRYRSLDGF